MLHGARDALPHVRRVLGLDGGHLRNKAYHGVLLMLTCKDAENHIIPLCIGVVESENGDSWLCFLKCLRHAAPFLLEHQSSFVAISDFDKGIWAGVSAVFPDMKPARDIIHLKNNIVDKCKSTVNPSLVKNKLLELAAASTERKYKELLEQFLRQCFTAAQGAVVRRMLVPEQFADFCFKDRRRYGTYTSQFAESANNWVSDVRTAPGIVDLVRAYLGLMSKAFSERKGAAERLLAARGDRGENLLLSKYAETLYTRRLQQAQHISLFRSNVAGRATVRNQATGSELEVDVVAEQCNCHRWQFDGIPCGHGVAVMLDMGVEPRLKIDRVWTARALLETYSGSLVSLTTTPDLDEDDLLPPVAAEKKVGRPSQQKRHLSRGEVADKVRCGNCGRFGHNRKTCKFPRLNPHTVPSMKPTSPSSARSTRETPPSLPPRKAARGGSTTATVHHRPRSAQFTRQQVTALPLLQRQKIAEQLLNAVPEECRVCERSVDDDDEFIECLKCCRWLHEACLSSSTGRRDRYVCADCAVAVPTGQELFPCSKCKLNVLNHSVMCDVCDADTHLVCVDVDAGADLDALDQFLCSACARDQGGSVQHIVPCRNVGNTCYFNCLVASLQALPVPVLANLSASNTFLRLVATNVVKQRLMVGRHAVESCVTNKHYCSLLEDGREHDVAEAFDYVLQQTKSVACLEQEVQFQYRDVETCGGCGRVKVLESMEEHCLRLCLPPPRSSLTTLTLQELVWHTLEHGEIDRLCSNCSESAGSDPKQQRQHSHLRTAVLKEPNYLVASLRREFVEPPKASETPGEGQRNVKRSARLAGKRARVPDFRTTKSLLPIDQLFTQSVKLKEDSGVRYSVCAVAYHRGQSISSGHWWAHVQHPVTGRWWRVDDGASSELQGAVPQQPASEATTASFLVLKSDTSGLGGRSQYTPSISRCHQLLAAFGTSS